MGTDAVPHVMLRRVLRHRCSRFGSRWRSCLDRELAFDSRPGPTCLGRRGTGQLQESPSDQDVEAQQAQDGAEREDHPDRWHEASPLDSRHGVLVHQPMEGIGLLEDHRMAGFGVDDPRMTLPLAAGRAGAQQVGHLARDDAVLAGLNDQNRDGTARHDRVPVGVVQVRWHAQAAKASNNVASDAR